MHCYCNLPLFICIISLPTILCWTNEELSMFDLVEEVNKNFYELFEISPTATPQEIRKAYRRQSLVWHPDKNKSPDASEKFNQIAQIYDVLKDEELRIKYDDVLVNGLPTWRNPIFYYRRMRKMPWWELVLIVVGLTSGGHYLILWASYFEKRLVADEWLTTKLRRMEKEMKKQKRKDRQAELDDFKDETIQSIPRPTLTKLYPCLLVLCLIHAPAFFQQEFLNYKETRRLKRIEEEELRELELNPPVEEVKKPKRKICIDDLVQDEASRATDVAAVVADQQPEEEYNIEEVTNLSEWTVEETVELIRLISKHPVGTADRWERISRQLRRKFQDVTDMAAKLKKLNSAEYQKLADMCQKGISDTTGQNKNEQSLIEQNKSVTKADAADPDLVWSACQQKCLESALQQFSKDHEDRWTCIARCVPGKTKEECVTRYKELAALVRRKRAEK